MQHSMLLPQLEQHLARMYRTIDVSPLPLGILSLIEPHIP